MLRAHVQDLWNVAASTDDTNRVLGATAKIGFLCLVRQKAIILFCPNNEAVLQKERLSLDRVTRLL